MAAQRNRSIDCLRLLAAFSVVCLHTFSNRGVWAGEEITALSRYAVPLFFLFSGFFAAGYDRPRLLRQILRILGLCVFSHLLYLAVDLWSNAWWVSPGERLAQLYTLRAVARYLLFNQPPVSAHLWFLGALLYVLLLDLLFSPLLARARHPWRWRAALAAILFFGGLAVYYGCTAALGDAYPLAAYRNFLFLGVPFYLGGKLLRKDGGRLPLPGWGWALVLAALMGLTLAEFSLLGPREIYLGQALLALALARLAVDHPLARAGRPVRLAAWLGQHCALPIYIVHVIFLSRVEAAYYRHFSLRPGLCLFHLNPFITFALSLGTALLLALGKRACHQILARLRAGRRQPSS